MPAAMMKRTMVYIRIIFVLAAAFVAVKPARAQLLTNLQQNLEQYRQNTLQEKLYVHTDKNYYLTGEILWFKVYDINGGNNAPLNLSNVAYIELLDNNHKAVLQEKIELKNTAGSGSVYIPVSINNGNYKLRAYTNWMKNFSPDYYFEKTITIINPLKSPPAVNVMADDYNIQLFPEGGNMVNNIAGKVGFKIEGTDAKASMRGAIINQQNDTLVRFSPLKFGMGSFMFTPTAGNTYRVVLIAPGNKTTVKPVTVINNEGYTLQVSPGDADTYNVTVKASPANQNTPVYMLVHTRQLTKIAESKTFENGIARFAVDKAKLDDGISSITIFNANMKPVAERLIFKYPANKLLITASADQAQYNTRKKVNISIAAKDQVQAPVSSDLSLAVYKVDSLQTVDESDILSYLWLSSDLRGKIESPGYYFKNNDATTADALDNLLLTQGWRRFNWDDVVATTPPHYDFLPEYNGHLVNARIKKNAVNEERAGIVGYLGIPGKKVQLYTAKSNSEGKFVFNTKLFYGAIELVAQSDYTREDSTYRIEITSPFSDKYGSAGTAAFNLKPGTQATLKTQSLAMQVQNLYSANNNNRFFEPVIDTIPFYGPYDKAYRLDDYVRFPTTEEVLREYVTWVLTSKSKGKFQMRLFNEENYLREGPLVMLDGIPIFDIDKVYTIDPLKVRRLEVIHNRYFYGPASVEGILSFTTYKGDMGGFEIDPKAVIVDYEGLNLKRIFYSPAYETDQQINSRLPDFRNLLYWAPNITTRTQGISALSFYTSDQQGKYIGIVQGITADGKAGSQFFNFEVKK